MMTNRADLCGMIDRHGANLAAWPDQSRANEVRAAILADRALRAYLEDAITLDDGLRAARDAMDAEIEESGVAERVSEAVLARLTPRSEPRRPMRWIAVAAAILVSAGLGSAVDLKLTATADSQSTQDVVVLDPLVFGPTEIGLQ